MQSLKYGKKEKAHEKSTFPAAGADDAVCAGRTECLRRRRGEDGTDRLCRGLDDGDTEPDQGVVRGRKPRRDPDL